MERWTISQSFDIIALTEAKLGSLQDHMLLDRTLYAVTARDDLSA